MLSAVLEARVEAPHVGGHRGRVRVGGEPIEGCDAVTLLVVGNAPVDAESRARDLGVWHPSAWNDMRIKPQDVALALADKRGFAWKPGHERHWHGSDSWPGHGSA